MQPSEYEIQREVEALRDIKRRSTTPGALAIDPDLPNPTSASTSPTSAYWSGDGDSSSASHEDSSSSGHNSVTGGDDNAGDDPFHLFWVPASVHPEIAPAEFRAFLKEHARSPPPSEGSMSRTGSLSSLSSTSSGLGRKRSMLSRQYRPSENDGVGEHEETIVPLRRSGTSLYKHGPQLTISDLQRLEELAEEASESDDPSKLRSLLRRSLSMNMSPTAMGMDGIADIPEDVDAPIILPPSNQILRRANRTKIRKPGLPGDGGGHRFGASRRGATPRSGTTPASFTEKRTSSDRSSSDHGDDASTAPNRRRTFDTDSQPRPESYSDEAFIFDAYVREEEESEEQHATPVVVTASPPSSSPIELPPIQTDSHTSLFEALEPVLHHPQPQRLVPPSPEQQTSRTPSPSSEPIISPSQSPEATHVPGTAVQRPPSPSYSPPPQSQTQAQRKEKDKKGLFGKWGADKVGKKGSSKEKEKESRDRAEKESKDSSFFGSLFGGKKHKESDGAHVAVHGGHSGREAAAALLGSSKSAKNYQPPPSPVGSPGVNNWSRYPIHVERAIYRLSHIKLANPRRPLYEQVLISNLMFWYLGVINKAQTPTSPADGQTNAAGAGAGAQTGGPDESEAEEKARLERERQEREKKESERLAREQKEKEAADAARKRESSPKRGPLTKPAPMNSGRRAEMPVKGPQYDVQHRVMEEEYTFGGGYNGSPQGRSKTPPNSKAYQQSQDPNGVDYYQSSDQQRLPPGAMQPLEQSWSSPNPKPVSPPPSSIGNNNPRRSRSPPQPKQGYNSFDSGDRSGGGGRLPGRSLSATVAPSPSPPPSNGKIRKGHSAYAGVPSSQRSQRDPSEDEDVPLAVWQQQQRRR